MSERPTQHQMYYAAQRETADMLQHALWLAGLDKSDPNPNPLTRDEVAALAEANRPSSWAFAAVLRVLDNAA